MRVIDAHHHLWALDTAGHEWPTPAEANLYHDFGRDDLLDAASSVPLAETVFVQPQPMDADWLLGAKPFVTERAPEPWRADRAALAAAGACCKLSGLRTEQRSGAPVDALAPHVAHLLDGFGERLLWGSDWPVLLSGDDYACRYRDADRLTRLHGAARERLFFGAAREFYGWEE